MPKQRNRLDYGIASAPLVAQVARSMTCRKEPHHTSPTLPVRLHAPSASVRETRRSSGIARIDGCTDSVDLSPYFTSTAPNPLPRTTLYTEWFYPNFEPGTGAGPTLVQQAIRNTSYKYLQVTTGLQGLFHISPDLTEDPWEDDNLISSTVEQDMTTLAFLQDELLDLTGGSLLDLCDAPFARSAKAAWPVRTAAPGFVRA